MSDIIVYLKSVLVPKLRDLGFKGSFPHFRRMQEDRIDLMTFQFNKWGTQKFVIELAVAPSGVFKTSWGEEIPSNKLTARDINNRLRLGAKSDQDDFWFQTDSNPETGELLEMILNLLTTQGENYFSSVLKEHT